MNKKDLIKLGISIIWDTLDFIFWRVPVLGTLFDIAGGFLAVLLWGKIGVLAFWEIIDITEQVDAYLPSLTLIGLISIIKG